MDVYTLKRWKNTGRLIASYTISRADAVIPVSAYLKKTIDKLAYTKYKFEIIPMGVEPGRFNPDKYKKSSLKTGGALRLLFVGKLEERKGVNFLLEAMDILKKP